MTRIEDRFERQADQFDRHPWGTGLKWFVIICGALLVLGFIGGVTGLIGDWGNEGRRIVSPENVREQHTQIINNWQAMEAAAQNSCQAKGTKKGPDDATILEDPNLAYDARYREIAIDYNRRMTNWFEGHAVAPHNCGDQDCPRLAPSLAEMQADKGYC